MRYTLNKQTPTTMESFVNFTFTWDDADRTIWAEAWNNDERSDYLQSFAYDAQHGIETPAPNLYSMIQAVQSAD